MIATKWTAENFWNKLSEFSAFNLFGKYGFLILGKRTVNNDEAGKEKKKKKKKQSY